MTTRTLEAIKKKCFFSIYFILPKPGAHFYFEGSLKRGSLTEKIPGAIVESSLTDR